VLQRTGFALLFLGCGSVACIFDKGDYKGGGRNPTGTASAEVDAAGSATSTSTASDSGGLPDGL
jgi:hypothetical protein